MNIKVENGNKTLLKQEVLKEINIECNDKQITGFIGRNGSGKTVLFKCICGFMHLNSGDVLINEKKKAKGELLRDVGILIDGPAFLENYSAYDNLDFLYRINHKKDKAKIIHLLEMVGLENVGRKKVGKFSLGMKQRLAIAQALLENPDTLILDEPFNGLDNRGLAEMRAVILKLKEYGHTILISSHNPEDIRILCDKVYELDGGKVVTK